MLYLKLSKMNILNYIKNNKKYLFLLYYLLKIKKLMLYIMFLILS